jgi:bifunctional ADP-heptose synthase (sugar kinase/adenylyltransferase)
MDTPQLKSYKILLLGDSCIDVYNYGTCDRLSPEAPVPVFKQSSSLQKPGMAANVQQNLLSFSSQIKLISNNKADLTKERFIDQKTNQHLLRVDKGETIPLSPIDIENIEYDLYDALVISDYDKGTLPYDICKEVSQKCAHHKTLLFVDSKKNDLSCFEGAIIKINEKEYLECIKFPDHKELIVTLGGAGAVWNNQFVESEKVDVFDVCGAGDTFFAGLIQRYLETKDLKDSIMFGNLCAAITVSKTGAHYLTLEEVRNVREKQRTKK